MLNPQIPKNKEYQTVRLFATLGILTLVAVLIFRVVLFGPRSEEKARTPAKSSFPSTKIPTQ